MSSWSCCTFVLIAWCCYSMSCSQAEQQTADKKVDLPNRISAAEHRQSQHAMRDEARQKRSQHDLGAEFKDFNDIIEDLEETNIAQTAPQEFDMETMPPLTYYLLLQKLKQLQSNEPTYRVRTPRLGRSIDFQLLDNVAADIADNNGGVGGMSTRQRFVSRVNKKSVPFKPRLGKRAQLLCD